MTQCRHVDTAVNALLDIDELRDDKVSAETGVTVCFSGREFKVPFEQLHRWSEGLDGRDSEIFVYGGKPSMRLPMFGCSLGPQDESCGCHLILSF
jgi:hypothetical protein